MVGDGGNGRSMISESFWHDAYDEHGGAIFAFLASRLSRREEAEDILHETFVRAIGARTAVRDLDRIRSYLFAIANNLLVNRYRRRPPLLFGELESDDKPLEIEDRSVVSPEDTSVLAALQRRLEMAITALPESHRRAFVLAVVEQRPYREVAETEGWSPVQVRVNVHRARKQLLAELADILRPPEEVRS